MGCGDAGDPGPRPTVPDDGNGTGGHAGVGAATDKTAALELSATDTCSSGAVSSSGVVSPRGIEEAESASSGFTAAEAALGSF